MPQQNDFYREEFAKCQQCLEEQREHYSERAVSDVEEALGKVLEQLDHLCAAGNADQVVSRLLRQFDLVTGASGLDRPTAGPLIDLAVSAHT